LPARISRDEAKVLCQSLELDLDEHSFTSAWNHSAVDGYISGIEFIRHAERLKSAYWNHRGKLHIQMDHRDPVKVAAAISEAAQAIHNADAVLITTGAGAYGICL
jgi:hypothetical protein